jgi:glycosyltransferase involved in cell wall biosynthesis
MEDTIEESLRSILEQVDERFEVLVVDDGSTDDSVSIIQGLMSEFDTLRLVQLDSDTQRTLGETRNISVEKSSGEYTLLQLDADDVYYRGIVDFAELYRFLDDELPFDFYLKGKNINVGRKDFLLKRGPYRNLQWTHDRDLWRRLFADDSIIWLNHYPISEEIGYGSRSTSVKRELHQKVCELQSGVSPRSYLDWSYERWREGKQSLLGFSFDVISIPLTYLYTFSQPRYNLSDDLEKKSKLAEVIDQESVTLPELEERYDITIPTSLLTSKDVFYDDLDSFPSEY